ncbi:hypothetical protein [Undibacterium sp. Ji22W]|uniref:hypothetical protein n=1 Tax=Undibacterium sp. Ji22W TaxID=3413038 RepID=UPI003BF2F2CA
MKSLILFLVCNFYILDCYSLEGKDLQVKAPLTIEGNVDKKFSKKILAYVKAGGRSIIVNSYGGNALYGQEIALFLMNKRVSVTVDKYCFSACANYLFLSGYQKNIREGSILGFHGAFDPNALSASMLDKKNRGNRSIELLVSNEKKFRKEIGIDLGFLNRSFDLVKNDNNFYEVTVFGKQTVRKVFPVEQKQESAEFIADFLALNPKGKWSVRLFNEAALKSVYFPSKESLINYGVSGIENYPYPKSQKDLDDMAKRLDSELKIVGEFKTFEEEKK